MYVRMVVVACLSAAVGLGWSTEAHGIGAAELSDKVIQCLMQHRTDRTAAQSCIRQASAPYQGQTMSWKGKVTGRGFVVGATASGWGFYAIIADDQHRRMLYIEFKRGSAAFTKIMNPQSGFGPKGFKFFRAKGTFKGFKISSSQYCGGNRNCYVPMLVVTDPSQFDDDAY